MLYEYNVLAIKLGLLIIMILKYYIFRTKHTVSSYRMQHYLEDYNRLINELNKRKIFRKGKGMYVKTFELFNKNYHFSKETKFLILGIE